MSATRKIAVLLVAVLVVVVLAAIPAAAQPGNNGKGADNANSNASFGIQTAIIKSGSGCEVGCTPL